MQSFKHWTKTWQRPLETFVGLVRCGWQPKGASLQVVRRPQRVAAKTLPVFAQLIQDRVKSQGGFINSGHHQASI